jgi:hypothetical protein
MYARSIHTRIGEVSVTIASFRWNLLLIKQVGGRVVLGTGASAIAANQRNRPSRDTSVDLVNFYFVTEGPPAAARRPVLLPGVENPQRRQSVNQRCTVARHLFSALRQKGRAGVGPRHCSVFPAGVLTVTTVAVGGERRTFVTAAGETPDDFAVAEALRSDPATASFAIGAARDSVAGVLDSSRG